MVDHIAQTKARGAENCGNLLAGRCPPAPPDSEALRSGAAAWAPWPELVDGLHAANHELLSVLALASEETQDAAPTVRTILVVTRSLPDGKTGPHIFVDELGWKEYAILQRLHLLDHRTQVKKLSAALEPPR